MTDLELMICEAENCGEIDLDTRDILLATLESTRYSKEADKALREYRAFRAAQNKKIEKLEEIRKTSSSAMQQKIDEKISKVKNETTEKYRALKKSYGKAGVSEYKDGEVSTNTIAEEPDDKNYITARQHGKKAAKGGDNYRSGSIGYGDGSSYDISGKNSSAFAGAAARTASQQSGAKQSPAEKRKPGLYSKESTMELRESVYEKELAGEITVEEREVLLSYIDSIME